jgi:hypothetical protein
MTVKIETVLPGNDKNKRSLKSGAMDLKELSGLKFLDPSGTAAIGRYGGMLKFISGKNGVTRAEIESCYRQGKCKYLIKSFIVCNSSPAINSPKSLLLFLSKIFIIIVYHAVKVKYGGNRGSNVPCCVPRPFGSRQDPGQPRIADYGRTTETTSVRVFLWTTVPKVFPKQRRIITGLRSGAKSPHGPDGSRRKPLHYAP